SEHSVTRLIRRAWDSYAPVVTLTEPMALDKMGPVKLSSISFRQRKQWLLTPKVVRHQPTRILRLRISSKLTRGNSDGVDQFAPSTRAGAIGPAHFYSQRHSTGGQLLIKFYLTIPQAK